jgi:hypothetical protein
MDNLQSADPVAVGGYRLIGRLGSGGMGRVFLGTSPGGRKVAVKLIHQEHANVPEFRERFTREIEAARRVGGFHTAPVVDADPSADPPWMVTAYIPGPSLQAAVEADGPLGFPEVRALGAGLAEGLAAIHACGLVHRDVKPSNVILADDGPRIIDFGIARAEGASAMTTTGAVLGTFSYMSPEQINGEHAGPASDVFSLGSALTFAATGHPPFGGGSIAVAVHHIVSQPPDLTGLPAQDGLRQLISECLAKDPADRPPLSAILARLAALGQDDLAGLSTTAAAANEQGPDTRTVGRKRILPRARQATEQVGQAEAGTKRRRLRITVRRTLPVAAAVVILAAAIALVSNLLATPSQAPGPSLPKGRPAALTPSGLISLAGVYASSQYGFDLPYSISVYGDNAWVPNADGNSVTELDASDGRWIRTMGGAAYGFRQPTGILDDGKHIWVTNTLGNSVTELSASDGSLIRTLSGGNYGFNEPETILDDGTHLWITNIRNSVTELSASDGTWIRTLSGGGYHFNYPLGLAFDGTHIWITNYAQVNPNYSVTEVNASDGSLVRVVSGPQYRFNRPARVAVADGSVWVTNPGGNTVTQFKASDGALVRILSGRDYQFGKPSGIALFGTHLFITNISANSVDVINAGSGSLEQIISDAKYRFGDPQAINIANSRAWIVNWLSPDGNGSVTVLKLS